MTEIIWASEKKGDLTRVFFICLLFCYWILTEWPFFSSYYLKDFGCLSQYCGSWDKLSWWPLPSPLLSSKEQNPWHFSFTCDLFDYRLLMAFSRRGIVYSAPAIVKFMAESSKLECVCLLSLNGTCFSMQKLCCCRWQPQPAISISPIMLQKYWTPDESAYLLLICKQYIAWASTRKIF